MNYKLRGGTVVINSRNYSLSKEGDSAVVWKLLSDGTAKFHDEGVIEKITAKFVFVISEGELMKFNRSTGCVVGFSSKQRFLIRPGTNK